MIDPVPKIRDYSVVVMILTDYRKHTSE